MTSQMKGRNLVAAAKRRGAAEPTMAQLRAQIMAGDHRVAPKAAKPAAAARKLPALPVALPVALPAAVEAERARITGLHSAAVQAARMGLGFDVAAAVASGASVQAVRNALVNDAAAQSDAVGEVATFASQSAFGAAGGRLTDARKRAAFAKGLRSTGGLRA